MITELLLTEGREGPAVCCLPGCTPLTAGWGAPRVGGRLPAVRSHQPPAATKTVSHYQPPPATSTTLQSTQSGLSWAPPVLPLTGTHQYRDLEKACRERGEGETGPPAGGCVGLCGAVWPLHSTTPLSTPALASPPRSLPHNLLQGIN